MTTHPDRMALTLAQRDPAASRTNPLLPEPGAADARIDLKLLAHATRQVLEERGTKAARARLEPLDSPHLWAGTVRDGVARGFMVALEEALSLCSPAAAEAPLIQDGEVFEGKGLRRKKDILVASGGARMRWSRRGGMLVVDRKRNVHAEDCLVFEDRKDLGTLDGFAPDPGERPRLFRPAFLVPIRLEQGPAFDRLELAGHLGRRSTGYPCSMQVEGRKQEPFLRVAITVDNCHEDHRLRLRFCGLPPPPYVEHRCTDVWEEVLHKGRSFRSATLIRACGRLLVGTKVVLVPAAQCLGPVQHEFRIGCKS